AAQAAEPGADAETDAAGPGGGRAHPRRPGPPERPDAFALLRRRLPRRGDPGGAPDAGQPRARVSGSGSDLRADVHGELATALRRGCEPLGLPGGLPAHPRNRTGRAAGGQRGHRVALPMITAGALAESRTPAEPSAGAAGAHFLTFGSAEFA